MPETSKAKVDLGLLNLDTLIAETSKEPFQFTLDGEIRTLPHFSTLSPRQALQMDAGNVEDVLAELAGEKLAGKIMDLPGFAADKLIEDWMAHAGNKPGE